MQVTLRGGTTEQKRYAKSIALFAGEKLMSKRLFNKLELRIQLIPNLIKKEGIFGDCIWEDEEDWPKEFTMRVDTSPKLRTMLETVAHEMVHVKQYARNELRELTSQKRHRFRGEYYDHDMDYYDEPWEIEAHGREVGLFVRWAEKNKLSKQKWTQV